MNDGRRVSENDKGQRTYSKGWKQKMFFLLKAGESGPTCRKPDADSALLPPHGSEFQYGGLFCIKLKPGLLADPGADCPAPELQHGGLFSVS